MAKKKTEKEANSFSKPNNGNERLDKILVENFVSLQKVMVNLSIRLEDLTKQVSKLLELFEISAKALAEKDSSPEKNIKENERVIKKIDALLDQNKIIARGLTLMHEKISEPSQNQVSHFKPQHLHPPQRFPSQTAQDSSNYLINIKEYQKSISSSQDSEELSDQSNKNANKNFKGI